MLKKSISFLLLLLLTIVPSIRAQEGLPVKPPQGETIPFSLHDNVISYDQLHAVVGGDESGLLLDLGMADLWGKIYTGPYPFEAGDSDYDYPYFHTETDLAEGKGTLSIADFFTPEHDPNGWISGGISTATPTIAYRMRLFSGQSELGLYGSMASFEKTEAGFRKLPTIIEGPLVTMVASDDPTAMEIVWRTDEPCSGEVVFDGASHAQAGEMKREHRVAIPGLAPAAEYAYFVRSVSADGRTVTSGTYKTKTAPAKGQGPVTFAYAAESYHGMGGEQAYMGCNLHILEQVAAGAYRNGAQFLIFGGDLIEGSSSEKENTMFQYRTWKQIMGPFWHTRPVYTGMGNHEVIFNIYPALPDGYLPLALDKWPYATESGEAVFAAEFHNPANGPSPADPRRPPYTENVYHFQYGPVMIIAFNNMYWWSGYGAEDTFLNGGSPAGYVMEDQLAWIEAAIAAGQNDPTVKFIFLFAHAPVFPYMNHVGDSMWYKGDNNERAHVKNEETGALEPVPMGIVEVRDRLWKAVSGSPKVGAVFAAHEHGYYRTRITPSTPVGVWPDDDTDGDGVLDRYSPNPAFLYPTWHITSGTSGSIYYAEDPSEYTPWGAERVTSHFGYVLIRAEGERASLEFIGGPTGAVLDRVDDLMAGK